MIISICQIAEGIAAFRTLGTEVGEKPPLERRSLRLTKTSRFEDAAEAGERFAAERNLGEIVDTVRPDWLQLHGSETPDRVAAIKKRFSRRTIKAVGIREPADLSFAERYNGAADRLLLDAKPPKDATRPGGNGAAFDWTILDTFDPPAPYLLSGGLDPQNVALALKVTGARGVDVSSGVESAPGRKDPALIRSFITAARKAVLRQPERTSS